MRHPTYGDLLSIADASHLDVREDVLGQDYCGCYFDDLGLILIDPRMSDNQKRCTLCHELVHARYHDNGCQLAGKDAERRTRRETALTLVNPMEYASAENVYEGDAFKIAAELDVTVQVIEDFKSWLSQRPIWSAVA
ncbi:ImmA/IrrE family metallo-endopeptidase [Bifidobacterium sp. ESL0790]|uniref:ImmA/IrrE family metallo-endopeptidase n=1 Tax=Bifidobacterium sp. ESL0790 TaxID=2983233 RepID=UPI0023F7A298|nr:ImmA/IrrE family metallo-endopeptidase [Bifidobacterium sp. ESL0790]WEV72115.1 ImmA/IrrE family metallo-endopeptidase [Bifidobacterium sp. ESL0790]